MSVKLSTISQWLGERNTKHYHDEDGEVIVFGATGTVSTTHFIKTQENGDMFSYKIHLLDEDRDLVEIPANHEYIDTIFKYILKQNYTTKFGCWEYDYEDGDIRYAIEIPLEDSDMTKKQFERVLSLSFGNVDDMFGDIKKILEDGEMPEDNSAGDLLRKLQLLQALEDGGKLDELLKSSTEESRDDAIDVDIEDEDEDGI